MCGLCGEFRWDGTAADTEAVGRMRNPLSPRGPNGTGLWAHGPAAGDHGILGTIERAFKTVLNPLTREDDSEADVEARRAANDAEERG